MKPLVHPIHIREEIITNDGKIYKFSFQDCSQLELVNMFACHHYWLYKLCLLGKEYEKLSINEMKMVQNRMEIKSQVMMKRCLIYTRSYYIVVGQIISSTSIRCCFFCCKKLHHENTSRHQRMPFCLSAFKQILL